MKKVFKEEGKIEVFSKRKEFHKVRRKIVYFVLIGKFYASALFSYTPSIITTSEIQSE